MSPVSTVLADRFFTMEPPEKTRLFIIYIVSVVYHVVMYRCERWIIKKAECQITEAFELWYWRRLESPLDCREIKPVNPKGNQP